MSTSITAKTTRFQRALSIIATLFGIITVLAGIAVSSGSNTGYNVFKPLLIFNTVMGIVYIAAGWAIWRSIMLGRMLSFIIFIANLSVLIIVAYLAFFQSIVAFQSVAAMAFRTTVWLGIYWGMVKVTRIS